MRPFLSLILLLVASVASGQSVKLPVEIKGEPAEFVRVKAETADKEVKWLALDKGLNLFPVELLKDTKTAVVIASKPGRYRLMAWTAKGDVPSDAALTVIVVGAPGPEPPPDPPPDPKPDPKPDPTPVISQKLWIVVIEETADATEERSLFFKDQDIAKRIESKGHRKRVFDKDAVDASGKQPAWMANYISRAKTLPYVILTDMQGSLIFEGPLVQTKAEFLKMLEKAGG